MPKEDYLLKYLEKLSRVIASMLGFREKGFSDESLQLADETFKELLNFDLEELAVLPIDKFIDSIRNKKYNSSYLEGIAQLTHETANALAVLGKVETAKDFYSKTLQLYYLLNEKDKTFSFEREQIISELLQLTQNN